MRANARYTYLRPGNLYKSFVVEDDELTVTSTGRVANTHKGDGTKVLKGCLCDASDEDRSRHSTKDHVVTHTIEQAGKPKAKRGDRLILGERIFVIIDIDDCGSLGVATLYYAEERRDLL